MKKQERKTIEDPPSGKNFLLDELKNAKIFLEKANIENPLFEAEIIFAEVLNLKRFEIYLEKEIKLSFLEKVKIKKLLQKRKSKFPLAYVLKKQNFYGRDFYVNPQVLIPRPETEELCELVLKYAKGGNLADLGCGSGCIGITLFLEAKWDNLLLSDNSRKALAVCKKNCAKYLGQNQRVKLLKHDFTRPFKAQYKEKFHVVVSNPPYVLEEEWDSLPLDVKNFEPKKALLVKEPQNFYPTFFKNVNQILQKEGMFFLETSPQLIDKQKDWLSESGFYKIKAVQDLSKKNRFLIAWKKDSL